MDLAALGDFNDFLKFANLADFCKFCAFLQTRSVECNVERTLKKMRNHEKENLFLLKLLIQVKFAS